MKVEEFREVMAATNAANKEHGIDFRGKSYLEVSKRVEIFRTYFGVGAAIITTPHTVGTAQGETVVMQAAIQVDGSTIATGTACEVIGQGNVNKASALENAETSAIGRALATLGLHGGEFASMNEMAAIGSKPENLTQDALQDAWEDGILDSLQDDPSPEAVAEAYARQIERDFKSYKTLRGLNGYKLKRTKQIDFIGMHSPELHSKLKADFEVATMLLKEGAE